MTRTPIALCALASLALGGCGLMGGVFVDRSKAYLEAETKPPLELPPDLSDEFVVDALAVPELPERPQQRFFVDAPPRPSGLFGSEEGDSIRIQMLGEQRWLVIPQTPALVWPKLKQFFIDNGVRIAHEAPSEGRLVTEWIDLHARPPRDLVRRALAQAKSEAGIEGGRERLHVVLEQGLRANTSEVVVRHENDLLSGASSAEGSEASSAEAGLGSVELGLLNELGAYVAADVGERSFSFRAAALTRDGKAVVTDDADGHPALRLELDFDRAWATLRRALDEAGVEIRDMDRSAGVFYLRMTDSDFTEGEGGGMLSRWFGEDAHYDVTLRLRPDEDAFLASLYRDEEIPVEREKGQYFLVKLRELGS